MRFTPNPGQLQPPLAPRPPEATSAQQAEPNLPVHPEHTPGSGADLPPPDAIDIAPGAGALSIRILRPAILAREAADHTPETPNPSTSVAIPSAPDTPRLQEGQGPAGPPPPKPPQANRVGGGEEEPRGFNAFRGYQPSLEEARTAATMVEPLPEQLHVEWGHYTYKVGDNTTLNLAEERPDGETHIDVQGGTIRVAEKNFTLTDEPPKMPATHTYMAGIDENIPPVTLCLRQMPSDPENTAQSLEPSSFTTLIPEGTVLEVIGVQEASLLQDKARTAQPTRYGFDEFQANILRERPITEANATAAARSLTLKTDIMLAENGVFYRQESTVQHVIEQAEQPIGHLPGQNKRDAAGVRVTIGTQPATTEPLPQEQPTSKTVLVDTATPTGGNLEAVTPFIHVSVVRPVNDAEYGFITGNTVKGGVGGPLSIPKRLLPIDVQQEYMVNMVGGKVMVSQVTSYRVAGSPVRLATGEREVRLGDAADIALFQHYAQNPSYESPFAIRQRQWRAAQANQ